MRRPGAPRWARGDRARRRSVAAQLLAATWLLGEHDLWPGSGALRAAGVAGEGGASAVLGGLPCRLSDLHRRLGGGEAAVRLLLERAVDSVAAATALPASFFRGVRAGHELTLAPWLDRLLESLGRPLDEATARSLWCARWRLPEDPAPGEVAYWSVAPADAALRLAVAHWVRLSRQGTSAAINRAPLDDTSTAALPVAAGGTLILVGELGPADLAAAERWSRQDGCSAIAIGRFPGGWDPPRPPVGGGLLEGWLSLAGAAADTLRRTIDGRRGRFDPMGSADREALTRAAAWRFEPPPGTPRRAPGRRPDRVSRLLALLPDGVPEGLLVVHGGVPADRVRERVEGAGGVYERARCRLAEPRPLLPDPLHRVVADLFQEDDPRRLLHRFLAGEDGGALAQWCRQRNRDLDTAAVRSLLGQVEAGVLREDLLQELAESCLSELDLAGARRALDALAPGAGRPWRRWLQALDRELEWTPAIPSPADIELAPRASAEVALWALRAAVRDGGPAVRRATTAVSRCLQGVDGAARRLCEINRMLIERPQLLADPGTRRELSRGGPRLRRRFAHCRALALARVGRTGDAVRVFRVLLRGQDTPGWKGLYELDAGLAALLQGRDRDADLHNLRALRLLQAAGFSRRTRSVVFNMAVADLDRLEVRGARARLAGLGDPDVDPNVRAELARLALATGREDEFAERVAGLPDPETVPGRDHAESTRFLRGVGLLLKGDLEAARGQLAEGGQEARAWMALVAVLTGSGETAVDDDGWGVSRAAALLETASRSGSRRARRLIPARDELGLRDAFALALLERTAGHQAWVPGPVRAGAVDLLRARGLDRWARHLAAGGGWSEGYLAALVKLVDGGGPTALGPTDGRRLVEALGLTGIEIRAAADDSVLWRVGEGGAGEALRAGPHRVVPLGGSLPEGSGWELLRALLELLGPPSVGPEDPEAGATGLHGVSSGIARVRAELRSLARSQVPVLLLGETGVGKEVAAHALHRLSGRRGRFVPVNVAAIPANLVEAELFGVVRGAFTGADRPRRGLVEAADGGTLFLDEVGEIDLPLQAKLLRFLESYEVRPVGSDLTRTVDVRVVAATNQDLDERRRQGLLRSDLYYRMAVAPVVIPPLRQRPEDIPVLRDLFARQAAARHGLPLARWSRAAEQALSEHRWPGNVRELRHVVEVAMLRSAGGVVQASPIPGARRQGPPSGTWEEAQRRFRRELLEATLELHAGNRSASARALGITRQTLLYHLKALGLDRGEATAGREVGRRGKK